MTFDPCHINLPSLCPINASIPVEANGLIPIGPSDLAGIPSIAFQIPDFEGQAIIRLFSNTTQSQVACYAASMTNGHSFSHPGAIGSTLGVFVLVALISSAAVAIYGQSAPEMRKHYAHTISVFVVFSVLQHIFYTGSLSMNWPSVLVAFWSNYAWSAGMIYSKSMQNSINQFIGGKRGDVDLIGSALSDQNFTDLGGGYDLGQLYKREQMPSSIGQLSVRNLEHALQRRTLPDKSSGFKWYGYSVAPGLPLPGNYSSMVGTLAEINIPASNAFLTGLLWFLVLVAIIAASVTATKYVIEALDRLKLLRTTHLDLFRSHWVKFTTAAILRAIFIAFFMIMYLTLFQFTIGGANGVLAVAAVVFVIFLVGMLGVSCYAVWYRMHISKFKIGVDKLQVVARKNGSMRWYGISRESAESLHEEPKHVVKDFPWLQPHFVDQEETLHVHDDEKYLTRFGWLSSRFRRSRWWFFSAWLLYEFVRACLYGGAAGHPLTQVFGLLAWEIIALVVIVILRPFESNRMSLVMIYLLGFSKVATLALSSAFDPRFGLNRVLTTAIGIIIVVIQGSLTICLMITIVLGAISSYMSITRYHESFKPQAWANLRTRYFEHIEHKATDKPRPPPPPPPPEPETPKEPYFSVASVRRELKIEDENPVKDLTEEVYYEVDEQFDKSAEATNNPYLSRANSIRSRTSTSNLPFGARQHRRSWSIRDFSDYNADQSPSGLHSRVSVDSMQATPSRLRSRSMKDLPLSEGQFSGQNADSQARRHRRTRSSTNPHGPKRLSTQTSQDNEITPVPLQEE